MTRRAFFTLLGRIGATGMLPILLGLVGCSRPATPEAVWIVRVSDQMIFTPATLVGQHGRTVRIRLESTLTAHASGIRHNLTILTPGSDVERFGQLAATAGTGDSPMPEEFRSRIVAQTPFVASAESTEISLTLPEQPGDYPVVCSFPGHCLLGMRGTLTIR